MMINDKSQRDGIRYPAIDQLDGKTSSKYKLVIAVAKRAREISEQNTTVLKPEERHNSKAIGLALEEIMADKVEII